MINLGSKPWGRRKWVLCLCWALAALVLACPTASPAAGKDLRRVTVRLVWVHQAQFAGFYVAKDKGIYERYGLDVNILPGGPSIYPLKGLRMGDSDFSVAWLSTAIVSRLSGAPIVNLAQVVQHSALLLVAFKKSGIKTIKDLNGRRVGMWESQFALAPAALFRREKIKVNMVRQNISIAPLLRGGVDAAAAMRYNEFHQLYQAGVDPDQLVVFDLADLGVNFPEDGIYALESTWQSEPDLCRRFVQATLDGWRQTFADPEYALEAVMKRVKASQLATNRPHQRWMLKVMQDLISDRVTDKTMGSLSVHDFNLVNRVLLEEGLIDHPARVNELAVPAWEAKP